MIRTHEIFISLGSNIEPERHLPEGLKLLEARFGLIELSTIYESAAVGFDGDNFHNAVARFHSPHDLADVAKTLRDIESACGRTRSDQKFAARTLDLDLLLFSDLTGTFGGIELPRDEITRYAFVLKPLAEMIGERIHPPTGQTYYALWQAFDAETQPLWPVSSENESPAE